MIRLPLLAALLIAGCCLNCVPYMAKAPALQGGDALAAPVQAVEKRRDNARPAVVTSDGGPTLPMTVVPAATQTPTQPASPFGTLPMTPTATETPCLVKCPTCIDQCAQIEGRPVPTR